MKTDRNIRISIFCLAVMSIALALPLSISAQSDESKHERPKVALVLSGGGAKGFSHIGILKVLEEEGIPVDLIVGTSIGSLVGGIYSLGYTASEIEKLVKTLDWETILSDDVPRAVLSKNDQMLKQRYLLSFPIDANKKPSLPQGLIKGQNVLNFFCGLAGNVPSDADFTKLPIPYSCVAVNLENGKEIVLKNGFLPTAMFSSMAIPIAFQSAEHNGLLLVDGGLANNFPTDVAKQMGADIIIGVDLAADYYDRERLNTLNNVIGQLVNFFDQTKDTINNKLCDLIIYPDVSDYSISSFNNQAADTLIARGEKTADKFRGQLRELKAKHNLERHSVSRIYVKPDYWHISKITFSGNYRLDPDFLEKTLSLKIPGNYTSDDIKSAIDKVYGLGGFDRIYYNLIGDGIDKTLNINIETKRVSTINVGFKANTTDAAAILINATKKDYKNLFGLLSASAELSVNPGVDLMAETNKTNGPTLGIEIKSKYQNYNVFNKGKKIAKANVFYTSASVYLYRPFIRHFDLGMGIQEEYFHGDIFRKSNNNTYPSKSDKFLTNAYAYLQFDNMNDFYFPHKGIRLYTEFALMADNKEKDNICPTALFKMKNVIPLDENFSLLLDIYGRAIFNSQFPLSRTTLVGGEPYSQYFNYHLPFVGLSTVNMAERYVYVGLMGLRAKFSKNQYASIIFNAMMQDSDFWLKNNPKETFGIGIKYSTKTMLGPLDFTIGHSRSAGAPTFSANFGYWF